MTEGIELLTSAEIASHDVRVVRFEADFALSRPYRVAVELHCRDDAGLPVEVFHDLMAQPCAIRYSDDGAIVHGRVRSVTLMRSHVGQGTWYRMELVPVVELLDANRRSRIFQDLDLPGLIRTVFGEAGLREGVDFDLRGLTATHYPRCEQIVQYDESDFAFVSRWLEHWGVHYHFVQEEDHARMVLGDSNRVFTPYGMPSVPWLASVSDTMRAGVFDVHHEIRSAVGRVVLRDYNWRTPSVSLELHSDADVVTGVGFHYAYGEHFKDRSEGQALAGIRAQELTAHCDVVQAKGILPGLLPGMTFSIDGHPVPHLSRDYFVEAVHYAVDAMLHAVDATGAGIDIRQELTLLPLSTTYRPPRRTPRPRIDGVMHGIVDGAIRGTAAPIDEEGRYKVLFPFDLIGNRGGHASRWIRVAQPSSGAGYGMHFPLHVGAEVMVAHVGGDPDRPVIVGSVHNTITKNPVTSANPTQSQLRTQAGVRILIDDDC